MMSFVIEHTADRAFRVVGREMAALLENAACAMGALEGGCTATTPPMTREVEVKG